MSTEHAVTLRDIAESAGVSIGTVSLALNEGKGIAPGTRQRILDVARSLGYERFGRRTSKAAQTVSILIERLPVAPTSDPFNKKVLQGLEAAARRMGYRIALEFVSPDDHPETDHWVPEVTAGLIILGGGDLSRDWVQAAIESRLPVVMLDHFVPGIELPSVVPDNFAGAYSMTQYLLDMGHERIGFIRGPSKYWTLGERLAGYMLAIQRAGLDMDLALVPPRISRGEEKGYGEMQMLLDLPNPPTAVFAVSDKTAIGAYRAAQDRGLLIPDDISIVGFDDIELARVLNPPLTTVQTPGETMGQVAFERLLSLVESEEQDPLLPIKWTIPTKLIIRKSVRNLRT
ncbi:LacI family transcriptional regulator [Ktedonosporobacter rubrisoli]|uniref:LacI family transcriptional regulator n=1 Tax=Ktedonosporobacter rubrisoli TaxID=2509675 RepID=A0A4P6K0D0_KTERU|nr:LacI family DNA-binding transcriptional regulator [Ktedonosporobacter rubrisoli]QBD81587.1 LacI family transcriptional regulator [Ktedonosporobacter rubrisoli]